MSLSVKWRDWDKMLHPWCSDLHRGLRVLLQSKIAQPFSFPYSAFVKSSLMSSFSFTGLLESKGFYNTGVDVIQSHSNSDILCFGVKLWLGHF